MATGVIITHVQFPLFHMTDRFTAILYDTLERNALCQEVVLEQSALYQTRP